MKSQNLTAALIVSAIFGLALASAGHAQDTAEKPDGSASTGTTGGTQARSRLRSGVIAEVGAGRPATVGRAAKPGRHVGLSLGMVGESTIAIDAQTYGRLRQGVIAEVGAGRPATVGMVVNPGPHIGLSLGMSSGRLSGDIEVTDLRQDIAGLKRSGDPLSPGLSHILDLPVAGNLHTSGVTTHLYYDLPETGPVTPYVGAGLGLNKMTLTMPGGRSEANVTRYEALVGIKASLGPGNLFAELRAGQSSAFSFKADGAANSKETKAKSDGLICGYTHHF